MIKSKLCQILETLNKEDWKGFERFVASPYFNTGEKSIQLLAYLKEKFWSNKWYSIEAKEAEEIIFGKGEKNEAYLRVVASTLTQLLEKYFIQKEMEIQSLYQEHFLRNALIKRRLFKFYEQQQKQKTRVTTDLEKHGQLKKGIDYYLAQYLSSLDDFKCLQIKKSRNISIDIVTDSIHHLDEFFLIHRLHLMNSHLSVQRDLQIEQTLPFLEEIMQIMTSGSFESNSLIQSYFSGLQLFLHPDEDAWFNKIQEQIEHQFSIIPKQELNEFYTIIINHYIRKGRKEAHYFIKVLELYKLMAQYDFLCPEQYITAGKYKNIVILGCHFQEFDWTKTFIEKYKIRLSPDNRESIYHLNLGAFYFSQHQFEKAQIHLIQVEPFDIYYTTDVKSLLLRIYYETKEYYAAEQAAISFKDFIRKQKRFTTAFKQSFSRFISILTKLAKTKQKYVDTQKRKEQLLAKVNGYSAIYHKKWLLEKINML